MTQTEPLIKHIGELRRRIAIIIYAVGLSSIIGYVTYPYIYTLIHAPFADIPSAIAHPLVIHSLLEGFFIRFKFAFLVGICLSIPVIIYQSLKFVFPALSSKEKKITLVALLVSFFMTLGGLYLVYFYILPTSISFLLTHHFIPQNVGIMLNFKQNIFYVVQLLFYSSLLFQFPTVLFLALTFSVLKRHTLIRSTRFVIVGIIILTAIFTPPDIVSQLGLAIPLILSYFGIIGLAKLLRLGEGHA